MVKKQRTTAEDKVASPASLLEARAQLANTIKESASQIWLAGLGAFAKAQEEGTKVFEALVREGTSVQGKSQFAAEHASRMSSMADEITGRAGQHWDRLESIFEDRVATALNRLGVPSNRDLAALAERIEALEKAVSKLAKAGVSRKEGDLAPTPAAAESLPGSKARSANAKASGRTVGKRASRKPAP